MQAESAPGRPRSESARKAVLAAAFAVLDERGYGAFSIDAVANRAGVARTTIYRWWPTKGLLAVESFLDRVQAQVDYEQTDSAAQDFTRMLGTVGTLMAGPAGRVAVSILAEGQRDPEALAAFKTSYHQVLRSKSVPLLQAGIARGELASELEPDLLLDAAIGAIYLNLMLKEPIADMWARQLASRLLNGALANRIHPTSSDEAR
jgi:AcrR family transcriptional regulator